MKDLEEALVDVADRHRHPIPIDPLHERARAAIERLKLDGTNLELAVAVFGWGSDEANGSLLGLLRDVLRSYGFTVHLYDDGRALIDHGGGITRGENLDDGIVNALEARQS